MSAEEFVQGLQEVRTFNRLKDVNLKDYNFDTIFMDPPRSGLDDTTRNLVKDFEQIIYISCNPETLHRDLNELVKPMKSLNLFYLTNLHIQIILKVEWFLKRFSKLI